MYERVGPPQFSMTKRRRTASSSRGVQSAQILVMLLLDQLAARVTPHQTSTNYRRNNRYPLSQKNRDCCDDNSKSSTDDGRDGGGGLAYSPGGLNMRRCSSPTAAAAVVVAIPNSAQLPNGGSTLNGSKGSGTSINILRVIVGICRARCLAYCSGPCSGSPLPSAGCSWSLLAGFSFAL